MDTDVTQHESLPADQAYCSKCRRTKQTKDFYKTREGKNLPLCKVCSLLGINALEPTTAYPLLKSLDIPFVPNEWQVLADRYQEKGVPKTQSVVGRYVSKMKLMQYKDYTFSDTERLTKEWEEQVKLTEATRKEQLEDYVSYMALERGVEVTSDEIEKLFGKPAEEEMALTNEEKIELKLKWFTSDAEQYSDQELIKLETFWTQMMEDFDIQTSAHKNYLKLICKCSLKTEQALDHDDPDAFVKFSKQYDMLMKSANFTATQNKEATSGKFDSVGELVRLCEENGGVIEPYDIDVPKDIVDITLKDMNNYTNYLVKTELNLGELIEGAISQLLLLAEQNDKDEEEALELTDEDFNLFNIKFEEESLEDETWDYLEEEDKNGTK